MSVYKKTEIVGTSGTGIDDAIQQAVARASRTLRNVSWFEVKEVRGTVRDGKVGEFQVTVELGFRLED